jgi:hypothetical protein
MATSQLPHTIEMRYWESWMAAQVPAQYTPQLVSYQAVQQYLAQHEWQVKQALGAPRADVLSRPLMSSHSARRHCKDRKPRKNRRKRDRRDCGKHGRHSQHGIHRQSQVFDSHDIVQRSVKVVRNLSLLLSKSGLWRTRGVDQAHVRLR